MGCSASSHAGVGIYAIPTDEGDTSWEDAATDRCRVRQDQYQCHQPEEACESLVSMACSNDPGAGSSPERRPLPRHLKSALRSFDGPKEPTTAEPETIPGWKLDNSILDAALDDDGASEGNHAFLSRRWLVLPEHQYDMDTPHPAMPPFLGSMYWTAANTPLRQKRPRGRSDGDESPVQDEGGDHVRSLLTPSTVAEDSPMEASPPSSSSPFTRFGLQAHDMHNLSPLSKKRANKLILSLNSTEDWSQGEATSVSSSTADTGREDDEANLNDNSGLMSPRESVDISRELLDYSALEESYILEPKKSLQTPRRLFDEGENGSVEALNVSFEAAPAPSIDGQVKTGAKQKLQSLLCYAPTATAATSFTTGAPLTPKSKPNQPTPSSPNVATFYGHWGSRRERHISTLPSPNSGEPVRLRVVESGLPGSRGRHQNLNGSHSGIGQSMSNSSPGDCYSYDPYFSTGKYTISLPNGKPYGNGLVMKMGWQFMILEDSRGVVLAVIKSRYTHTPSTVVYAPKARFAGQIASGHRLTRRIKSGRDGTKTEAVVVDGDNTEGEPLFPWALISKSGRTMEDDCAVQLVKDDKNDFSGSKKRASNSMNGQFDSTPAFRGRHGFDRELHTHTVVSRTTTKDAITPTSSQKKTNHKSSNSGKFTSLEEAEVPCCVIVRDPTNLDAVDITIAPGIDPLLMVCYMVSHSKMDVEPIMSGY